MLLLKLLLVARDGTLLAWCGWDVVPVLLDGTAGSTAGAVAGVPGLQRLEVRLHRHDTRLLLRYLLLLNWLHVYLLLLHLLCLHLLLLPLLCLLLNWLYLSMLLHLQLHWLLLHLLYLHLLLLPLLLLLHLH